MLLEYHRNLLAPLQQTVKTNLINDIPNHSNPFFHWTTRFLLKQMTLDWQSNRALNDRLALTALTLGHPNHRSATVLWPWCIPFIARLPEARTQRLKKYQPYVPNVDIPWNLKFCHVWHTFGKQSASSTVMSQAQRLCVLVPNQAVSKHAPSARRRRRGVPTGRSASGRHKDPRLGRQVQPTRNPSRTGLTFPNFYSLSAQVSADHFSCGSGIAHMRWKQML